MPRPRQAAVVVAALRIAYGAALVAAPARTTSSWLGAGVKRPEATVALRALGAREVVLHAGALAAALGGAPVRPWLLASIGGDCVDVAATVASRGGLPDGAPVKAFVVTGTAVAISAGVAAAVDS